VKDRINGRYQADASPSMCKIEVLYQLIDVVEVAVELSISVLSMEVGSSGSSLSPNWAKERKFFIRAVSRATP
jgi:hypothetical protein